MKKSTPRAKPASIAAEMTVTGFAGFVGMPMASVRDVLLVAGIPVNGMNSTTAMARALVASLRDKSGKIDHERVSAQRRQTIAEADNAELETVKRRGAFRELARRMFAEGFVQLKQRIEAASFLKPAQKQQMHREVQAIILPDDEDEA